MNDIEHNKAQCWCNRLHKLMKEKNYTCLLYTSDAADE